MSAARIVDAVPERDDGRLARQRVAAWLDWWKDQKRKEGIDLSDAELERRLGVASATVFRVRNGERLGLDVLLKIRWLLRISADTLLDEWPPGRAPKA